MVLMLFAALVLLMPSKDAGSAESTGDKSIIGDFASWQDWGGQSKPVKSLREALEMEHRAWEMTRQDTCSWEAGDPSPKISPWKSWQEAGDRCKNLIDSLQELPRNTQQDCWNLLVGACSALGEHTCGASWQDAHAATIDKLQISVEKPSYPLDDVSLCDDAQLGRSRSWTPQEWEQSLSWFERNVQVYVLEMPGLVISDEKETVSSLAHHGLQAVRIAGYNLHSETDFKAATRDGALPKKLDPSRLGDKVYAASVAASHFHIQTLASTASTSPSHKPIALVLEDGAKLAHDFQQRIWALIQEEIPCDWDVLSLSSSCPVGRCVSPHLTRIGPNANLPRAERCSERISRGFQGVLYRSAVIAGFRSKWMEAAFGPD
ncbi:unnamed protein product [Effrenium voratum]|nr:unnamed protein product [Effrenium voratum]